MVSVIIPVYNASKYLVKCLDSIRFQTYKDLEIILVNDASTDNSLAICQRYVSLDSRFVLIDKKKNGGVEKARHDGIQKVTGDSVCFVDSDDWLELGAIERMHTKLIETDADYVEIKMRRVLDRHKFFTGTATPTILGIIEQPELFEKYYASFFGLDILSVNMCGKLYKSNLLKKAPLPAGLAMGEDLYFNLCLFPSLKKIYIDAYVGYNYRFGGMTSHYNTHLYQDMKMLYQIKKQLIEKYNYTRVANCIRVEMRHVLLSDIRQKILFHYGTKEEIIRSIENELNDVIWIDQNLSKDKDKPIVQAILRKDANYLFEICNQEVRKSYPIWIVKRFVSKLLTII